MQGKKPHSGKLAKILQNRRGFIIIVGMAIVALTAYYSIMVQQQMINTTKEIKSSNSWYQAKAVVESVGGYIDYVVNKHEAGFSTGKTIECTYDNKGVLTQGGTGQSDPICSGYFQDIATRQAAKGNDLKIQLTVQGMANENTPNESYGECVGTLGSKCFSVPMPAVGDAGDKAFCTQYSDYVKKESQSLTTTKNQPMKDIDNPCNWSKLTFGSSLMDRVTIPLYYDNSKFSTTKLSDLSDIKIDSIKNIFKDDPMSRFVLRIRTPCLPCYDLDKNGNEDTSQLGKRHCKLYGGVTYSPYYCSDDDRYKLQDTEKDEVPDDMVISWQITGKCGNEDCGMIQYKDVDKSTGEIQRSSSAIIESFINGGQIAKFFLSDHIIIDTTIADDTKKPVAKDTSDYTAKIQPYLITKLQSMTTPVFSMFLSGKLLAKNTGIEGTAVPYLEYQFLTNRAIAQAKIGMEVTVIINGIFYREKLEKVEKMPLIDFAIQN